MKKMLFAFAFVSFALVSCTKARTCTCTEDGEVTFSDEIPKGKKSHQENVCKNFENVWDGKCELE